NLSKTELIILPPLRASSPDSSVRINSTTINPSLDTIKLLTHSLVIYRLNSLLIGLPLHRPLPLQSIMNTAARLIHLTNRSVSATPLYQSHH
ncbi:unnamed protein product, partial [Staurois parvus]